MEADPVEKIDSQVPPALPLAVPVPEAPGKSSVDQQEPNVTVNASDAATVAKKKKKRKKNKSTGAEGSGLIRPTPPAGISAPVGQA